MRASITLCLLAFYSIQLVSFVASFAVYLTEEHCHKEIAAGVEMMALPLVESSAHKVTLFVDGDKVDGNTVQSLDGLYIELRPKIGQSVLEIRSDVLRFRKGGCGGKRALFHGEVEWKEGMTPYFPVSFDVVGTWATSLFSGVNFTAPYRVHVTGPAGQDL